MYYIIGFQVMACILGRRWQHSDIEKLKKKKWVDTFKGCGCAPTCVVTVQLFSVKLLQGAVAVQVLY